jgi:hypothetical protein
VARGTSVTPPPGSFPERPKRQDKHPLRAAAGGWGGIVMINVLIWAVIGIANGGDFPYFWPVWLLIPFGIAVIGGLSKR